MMVTCGAQFEKSWLIPVSQIVFGFLDRLVLLLHWDRIAYVSSFSHRGCASDVETMDTVDFSPERDERLGATCRLAGGVCNKLS